MARLWPETRLLCWFFSTPAELISLFEAGRGRLSAALSLLFNRQYGLVGPFVFHCRCLSRCDIHPLTPDTGKSTSESTTEKKNAFLGPEIPWSDLQHSFPGKVEVPAKCNYLNYTSESTFTLQIRGNRSSEKHWKLKSLLPDSWERSTPLKWRHLIGGEEEGCDWLGRRHILCRLSAGTCYVRCPPLVPCNVCSPTHAIPRSAWLHPLIALLLLF